MKRVFVSHPFTDDPIGNKEKVDLVCKEIAKEGYLPISPLHLFAFMENDDERESILSMCYDLIRMCDEVWVYGNSVGCVFEREYARVMNIKVVEK